MHGGLQKYKKQSLAKTVTCVLLLYMVVVENIWMTKFGVQKVDGVYY
jgi:hypothetical protein